MVQELISSAPLPDLGDKQLLAFIYHELKRIHSSLGIVSPENFLSLNYPLKGGRRAVPAGKATIDFLNGSIKRPDATEYLSNSLDAHGLTEVKSALIWADSDLDIEAKWQGASRGRFFLSQCYFVSLQFMPMDKLEIDSDLPYNLYGFFSNSNFPAQIFNAILGEQERYGEITTTDSFTNILMGPTEGGELASAYRKANISVSNLGAKVFLVHNTGGNDADVNLQLLHKDGKRWVDSSITGASLSIPDGDNARIEDGTHTGFVRLRARSTTAGSPTTLECQYRGFSGVR